MHGAGRGAADRLELWFRVVAALPNCTLVQCACANAGLGWARLGQAERDVCVMVGLHLTLSSSSAVLHKYLASNGLTARRTRPALPHVERLGGELTALTRQGAPRVYLSFLVPTTLAANDIVLMWLREMSQVGHIELRLSRGKRSIPHEQATGTEARPLDSVRHAHRASLAHIRAA